MLRAACIWAAAATTMLPAAADAADVCVLVSSGSKRATRVYRDVAKATLERVEAERLDGDELADAAAVQKACGRVAITVGVRALKAALEHLEGVPIVYTLAQSAEQVVSGRASMYGVSATADPGHVLGTLQAIAPEAKRIGLVFNPKQTGDLVTLAKRVAAGRGLELVALEATDTGSAIKAFHEFEREINVDALWILPDSSVLARETADYALKLAHWGRLPVIGPSRSFVARGALLALTPDPKLHGQLAAEITAQVLRGKKPPALQYASDNSLLLSQRMADRLGLRLPPELVKRAEELIR